MTFSDPLDSTQKYLNSGKDLVSRNNSGGIDGVMATVIMSFNMLKIAGLFDARMVIDAFDIVPELGIVPNMAAVAFKVTVVNGIKAN